MKTLYLDLGMGAAGDMLSAALLELTPDPEAMLAELNGLGIPHVEYIREPAVKCGITGTHMKVLVHGAEEGEGHVLSRPVEIEGIVSSLALEQAVKEDILAVYGHIAQAESQVHGVPVTQIHFHEVGALDAVADITAVCLMLHRLQPLKILASAVHVGSGAVRCAHGILPVPAPATACLLRGIPIQAGKIQGELCTPTGAALLRHFVSEFREMPRMIPEAIGYGMGKKDFPQANCVRAILGREEEEIDTVVELRCNLDDMTGEALGFAMEELLKAGALDVFTTPVTMKKSRPGVLLTVLCREALRDPITALIFRHTTTLGVRETLCRRSTLQRREVTVDTPWGSVRRKDSQGFGVSRSKWEYEDLARIARAENISISQAGALISEGIS